MRLTNKNLAYDSCSQDSGAALVLPPCWFKCKTQALGPQGSVSKATKVVTFGSSYVTSGKESSGTPAHLQNGLSIRILIASLFLAEKVRDDPDAHQ